MINWPTVKLLKEIAFYNFFFCEKNTAMNTWLLLKSATVTFIKLLEVYFISYYIHLLCNRKWCRNESYFRLDGNTHSAERERMINQFNSPDNKMVNLFLLSTRYIYNCNIIFFDIFITCWMCMLKTALLFLVNLLLSSIAINLLSFIDLIPSFRAGNLKLVFSIFQLVIR